MWPDIVVGAVIAVIFLRSAIHVLGKSLRELRMLSASEAKS